MKKYIHIFTLLFFTSFAFSNSFGYLKQVEASFCMGACSQYILEDETGILITFLSNSNEIDMSYFIDRYVEIEDGGEYECIECSATIIENIYISDTCEYPVQCFVDPCEVADECQLNTPVDCIGNYCGGCYADFYDQEGNIVDCYNDQFCFDLSGIYFGICDMYMGVGYLDGECQGISGCGWEVDGVDYSDLFFDSYEDCQLECDDELSCDEIESEYNQLHSGGHTLCIEDSDCTAIWGDCGVGLGGCHYSVNDTFNYVESDDLVQEWIDGDCMESVCDCLPLPNSICVQGQCNLTYCEAPNPAGCFSSGCEDGDECIDFGNSDYASFCVPSSCFCDENYFYTSSWTCTEDCNGGICVPEDPQPGDFCIFEESSIGLNIPGFIDCNGECLDYVYNEWLGDDWCDDGWGYSFNCEALNFDNGDCVSNCTSGDVNNDGAINILDIVSMVECILSSTDSCNCSDINQDGQVNVIDIIMVVNLIIE